MYHKDNQGVAGSGSVYLSNQYIFKDAVLAVRTQPLKLIFKDIVLFT